jgi:hypothetical protein
VNWLFISLHIKSEDFFFVCFVVNFFWVGEKRRKTQRENESCLTSDGSRIREKSMRRNERNEKSSNPSVG